MIRKPSGTERFARAVRSVLIRIDVRVLVALVSVCGVLAWVMPWRIAAFFFVLACVITVSAATALREGRAALAAYGVFVGMWSMSQYVLYLFEHPGRFDAALAVAALLGARLFTLLGLSLAVPLAATPLMLARTLSWYLGWLTGAEAFICGRVFRGRIRPRLSGGVWRAALALCLMAAFFPRSLRAMAALRRSLIMRAPRLPLYKRVALMGMALLRVMSAQTWDLTLAIASRGVYRPGPWEWRKKA